MNDAGKTNQPQRGARVLSRRGLLKTISGAVLAAAAGPVLLMNNRFQRVRPAEAVSQMPECETLLHGAGWRIPH